jgi:hypothetical protein
VGPRGTAWDREDGTTAVEAVLRTIGNLLATRGVWSVNGRTVGHTGPRHQDM